MEVASLITNNKSILDIFEKFILAYSDLVKKSEDEDTMYFYVNDDPHNKFMFHYVLNDMNYEFSYNYTNDDIAFLKKMFGNELFAKDMSFKSRIFFEQLIADFKKYLVEKNSYKQNEIVVSHPFDGLINL